jgi:hypothetical protein
MVATVTVFITIITITPSLVDLDFIDLGIISATGGKKQNNIFEEDREFSDPLYINNLKS